MDFTVSEAQEELAGLARKILAGRGVPGGRPPGQAERDSPWADLAAAGVLAAGLPASLDGAGLGLLEQCSVLVEIGRSASDVPYLASMVLGAGAVAAFGTQAQQERWALPAGRGSVVLTAALAEEDGDDPSRPWLVARATVGRCAMQAGVVERALELTAEHARTRVQFGRPIGAFQAVAQRLADAYIDVEAVRLTMWQAAWLVSEGWPADVEVATAKFWAADAGHRVAHTAVHVHGGLGIDVSYPVHRYFAAAKGNEFALGGATAQLRRIGAALAADPG
jgi:alkylation response protein AidB-like acyl-CoA dehydrogenase